MLPLPKKNKPSLFGIFTFVRKMSLRRLLVIGEKERKQEPCIQTVKT
jgi:hypothetical protein